MLASLVDRCSLVVGSGILFRVVEVVVVGLWRRRCERSDVKDETAIADADWFVVAKVRKRNSIRRTVGAEQLD